MSVRTVDSTDPIAPQELDPPAAPEPRVGVNISETIRGNVQGMGEIVSVPKHVSDYVHQQHALADYDVAKHATLAGLTFVWDRRNEATNIARQSLDVLDRKELEATAAGASP